MKSHKIEHRLEKLQKALSKLEEIAFDPVDKKRSNIDATIQRFEFTTELFWLFLQAILQNKGLDAKFPKDTLQLAYQTGLIDEETIWLNMIKDRNNTSHTYNQELADEIYSRIQESYVKTFRNNLNRIIISLQE